MIQYLSKYDIAVELTTNPHNKICLRYCSRNKMYEALAAGLPILCSNIESYVEEFVNKGVAIVVDPDDIESITRGLNLFFDNPAKVMKMKKKAIHLSETYYNWATQEKKLIELYDALEVRK